MHTFSRTLLSDSKFI